MAERQIDPRCRLPAPTVCPYCQGPVDLVENKVIYGKNYGWPWVYMCRDRVCDSFVGTHKDTRIPKGTLANNVLRNARKTAHSAFDAIWQNDHMTRGEAYKWLAEKLDIDRYRCHIAWFDLSYCKQTTKICAAYLQENAHKLKAQPHPADAYF